MTRFVLLSLIAPVLLGGCRLFGPDHDSPRTDVDRARSVWAEQTNGTYAFDLFRGCFCVWAGDLRVEVSDYQVTAVTVKSSGESVPSDQLQYIHSIEQMFDLVEDARRRGAAVVEVEFSDRGFPSRINLDYSRGVADDELFLEIGNVDTGG